MGGPQGIMNPVKYWMELNVCSVFGERFRAFVRFSKGVK